MPDHTPSPAFIHRTMGAVNWRGTWTLYTKEVLRFLKIALQTLLAPVVTTLLFLAIFTLALGRGGAAVGDIPFDRFLAPGLIMMALVQNAFANTSSSLVIAKVQGSIVDYLMPPLSAAELTFGFAFGGVTRGILVGVTVYLAMLPFVDLSFHHLGFVIFHAVGASLMLSLLGLIVGIWGDKFDHIAAIMNFVILPMSFLSGTFYSVDRLPGNWALIAHLNPFFYMIDGLRYGLIGYADGNLNVGIVLLVSINVVLWAICQTMFARGWRLKP